MDREDTLKKAGDFVRNSATIKVVSIGVLVLILLIPTSMISSLMRERESRRNSVVAEINEKWGNCQTITGPFFTIPYKSFYKDEKEKEKFALHYLHILPETLKILGELQPTIRYRSIYEAVVYNSQLDISGKFTIPALTRSDIEPGNVLWDRAVFSIGITDMKGIKDKINIKFNGIAYQASPGLKTSDIASAGVQCAIPLSRGDDDYAFSFHLNLNGSDSIHFVPVAETTSVSLKSSWPSPSFNGAFLPVTRKVTDQGFSSNWKVLHLNRNYPQYWQGNQYRVNESSFGLKLLITADIYQKSMRIAKYALMFIIFTFAAFFFSEILTKKRVHPIQYCLIGLAVILFYVLLLSLSEYLRFDFAYILSAISITAAVTGYAKGILRSNSFTVTVLGILVILYAYLYIVLQLEDFALLMGSIGLFLVLITVMYITRKIDWYSPLEKG